MTVKRFLTIPIAAFIFSVLLVFGVRSTVCIRENARLKEHIQADFAPFQVESAIAWAQANLRAEGKDPGTILANNSEMDVDSQLAGGIEHFASFCIKLRRLFTTDTPTAWENNPGEAAFVQLMLALWIALGGGIIWLWLRWEGFHAGWCYFGSVLYAVIPSAVMRYTGQDLLKGAFALNFILLVMAFGAKQRSNEGKEPAVTSLTFLAALAAGCFWDMSQVLFGSWAMCKGVSMLLSREDQRSNTGFFLQLWFALILAAVITPYGRAHGSLFSPVLTVLLPWAVLCSRNLKKSAMAALLLFSGIWLGIMHMNWLGFAGNYSHFAELLAAKIKFMNIKPSDAGALTFNQRILWTPELHSADWYLLKTFFPAALPAAFLSTLWLMRKHWKGANRIFADYAAVTMLFFATFIFMVRFHELAAVFLVPWCVYCAAGGCRKIRSRFWKYAWLGLWIIVVPTAEAVQSFGNRHYSPGLPALAETVAAAREAHIESATVLADFELGSLLTGYAGTKIAIQPKFELRRVRETTQKYIELLYMGNIADFAGFCNGVQADYVFLRTGQSADPWHIYSYRYMANAVNIAADAPVSLLERVQDREYSTLCFRRVLFPDKYRKAAGGVQVFRFSTTAANNKAWEYLMKTAEYYSLGDRKEAILMAREAYRTDPVEPETQETMEALTGMKWDKLLFIDL